MNLMKHFKEISNYSMFPASYNDLLLLSRENEQKKAKNKNNEAKE